MFYDIIKDGKKVKQLKVRIRHRGEKISCSKISYHNNDLFVELSKKAFATASGQSAVFYFNGLVMGGGIIKRKNP